MEILPYMREKIYNKKTSMARIVVSIFIITSVTALLGVAVYKIKQAKEMQEQIANQVIRFHVRANSNEEDDQKIKRKVRDNIIEKTRGYFQNCQSKKEAEKLILEHEEEILQITKDTIYEENILKQNILKQNILKQNVLKQNVLEQNVSKQSILTQSSFSLSQNTLKEKLEVKISYKKEKFPLRIYADYAFPPGVYDTLCIDIGEASGKNWWCVMYPSLCYFDETFDETPDETSSEVSYPIFNEIFDSIFCETEEILNIKSIESRKKLRYAVGTKAYDALSMKNKRGKIKIKWKIYEIVKIIKENLAESL